MLLKTSPNNINNGIVGVVEYKLLSLGNLSIDPSDILAELNESNKWETQIIIHKVQKSIKPVGVDRRQGDQDKEKEKLLVNTASAWAARISVKIKPAGD